MPLTRLTESLRAPLPVYVVVGDAAPLRDRALRLLLDAVRPRLGLPAFNHTVMRCGMGDPRSAFSVARTVPMMADCRLVVVLDIGEARADFIEAFGEYASSPCPSTVLVLSGAALPKSDKGGNLTQRFTKAGLLVELSNDSVSPVAFARSEARALGKDMDEPTARLLVESIGADLGLLLSEVGKLATYVGEGAVIDAAAVEACTALLAQADVWTLTGAVLARDRAAAVLALARLTEADDQEHRLLGMLGWQLREVAAGLALARSGLGPDEVARRTRLRPGQARELRRWLDAGVSDATVLRAIANTNEAMNGHRAGGKRILERLVLQFVGV